MAEQSRLDVAVCTRPIAVAEPIGAVMGLSWLLSIPQSWKVLGISQQQSSKRLSTDLGEGQTF